VAEILFKWR